MPRVERPLPEVWNVIIRAVDNEGLFALSRTAKALNSACIRVLLRRSRVHREIFTRESAQLSPALQRVFFVSTPRSFGLTRVAFQLAPGALARSLDCIPAVVARCPHLTEVRLFMPSSDPLVLADAQTADLDLVSRCVRSVETLCGFAATIALGANGPMLYFDQSQSSFLACRARDLRSWKLETPALLAVAETLRSRSASMSSRKRRSLGVLPTPGGFWGPFQRNGTRNVRLYSGKVTPVGRVDCIESVTIHVVQTVPGPIPAGFSLLMFNDSCNIRSITFTSHDFHRAVWSDLLGRLFMPHLERVSLETNFIDPFALFTFLLNHPTIKEIQFVETAEQTEHHGPLIHPALSLPNLERVSTTTSLAEPRLGLILPALIGSPILQHFTLTFPAYPTALTLDGLLLDFKAIYDRATEAPRDGAIELDVRGDEPPPPDGPEIWSFHSSIIAAGRNLFRIPTVSLFCESLTVAHEAIPWLRALPDLRQLAMNVTVSGLIGRAEMEREHRRLSGAVCAALGDVAFSGMFSMADNTMRMRLP